jgi:serine/threonine-protein kinase PknK
VSDVIRRSVPATEEHNHPFATLHPPDGVVQITNPGASVETLMPSLTIARPSYHGTASEPDAHLLRREVRYGAVRTRSALAASTKFQPPAYDDGLVNRDRLIELLQLGRSKRLTLIHAPAGFGKTTLAVQWQRLLRSEGVPVAWLSLDRGDNEPVWFLSHLIQAVRRIEPKLGGELLDVLEQHSEDVQRYVLTELVNQLAEYRQPFVIAVDDWHVIDDIGVAAALDFLLDVGPKNLHLIVTSRTRTPSVGRLMVRNQVAEIDSAQLRFNQQESAAFLCSLNSLDLGFDDVHRLWSSTDGWIAALQLASLSLQNTAEPSALIRGFSGRHHAIGDYLAENVLDALSDEMLDFLLTTSICDRLSGGLASALSGQECGQALLEELERRNMFLRALDEDREWFSYHHLFAEHLRRRLERDHPERVAVLHATASVWFAEHGLLNEAVAHSLSAGDPSAAVDLVEQHAMDLVEHSRMSTLLSLVNRLPRPLLPDRPALQIAIAWANCLLQRLEPAQIALDSVRTRIAESQDPCRSDLLGEADVIQAGIDIYGDRIDRPAALVAPFISGKPRHRPWLVAVSANIQTWVDIHTFAYDTARARQQWARRYHEATLGPFAGVYGLCFAGLAAFAQLDLTSAERLYKEAQTLAAGEAGVHSHCARLPGVLLGKLLYERGDTRGAELLLEECHELGAEIGVVDFMVVTYTTLARIKVLHGDVDDAWSVLDEGSRAAAHLGLPRLSAAVDDEQVRLHLALGDLASAQNVLARQVGELPTGGDGIAMATRHSQLRTHARILTAQGDYAGAHQLLNQILAESTSAGSRYAEAVARAKLARVHVLEGDLHSAIEVVVPALIDGARSGFKRLLIDSGPELVKVIAELRDAQRCDRWPAGLPAVPVDYLSTLLAMAHADAVDAAIPVLERSCERGPMPEEPVSIREIEILRLLDRGLSNKQIARNLGITINTVKWHLKSIFTKLGVTRRGESVSEARRRKILA